MSEKQTIAEELARYRRRKLWPYLIILLVLLGGGAAGWYYTRPEKKNIEPTSKLYVVTKQDIVIAVEENATLRPKESIPVSAQIFGRGRLTVKDVIEEGSIVKKGDVLMHLDPKDFIADLDKWTRTLEDEDETIKKFLKDIEIQKIDNDKALKQADLDIARTKRELKRGLTSIEINIKKKNLGLRDKEISVKDSEIAKAKDKKNLDDTQELYKRGFASKEQLRDAELALESRKNTLERNKNAHEVFKKDLEVYLEVEVPQEKEKLKENLEKVNRNRERVERTANLRLERLQTQLKKAYNRKEYKLNKKKIAEESIVKCSIKSPADGTVVLVERRWRGKVKEGDSIHPGRKVIEIPSASDMKAICNIPEFDIERIRIGQLCEIRPDVKQNLVYKGKVTRKKNAAERDPESGNNIFEVEILLLEKLEEFIKPGMGARVTIITERLTNRLCIPVDSVFYDFENDRKYVYVYEDGEIVDRDVKTGKRNNKFVEIMEGLKEGEKVFIVDPYQEGTVEASSENVSVPKEKDDKKEEQKSKESGDQKPKKRGMGGRPRGKRPAGMPRGKRPEGMPRGKRPEGMPRGKRPAGMPRGKRPEGMPRRSR